MKKIYLLMIVLISGLGFAQGVGTYQVNFNITGTNVKVNISGNCGSRLESWLIFSNAADLPFFNQPIGDGENLPRNWPSSFLSSKKLTKIKYYSEGREYHGGFNSGCKTDNSSTESMNVSYGVTEYYIGNYFTNLYNLRATLKVLPKLHIQEIGPANLNDILPTGDKIVIKSDTGFLSTEYNWQYSINPDKNVEASWMPLPQFDQASISVSALDVLTQLDASSHGKKVHFRQVAYNKAVVSNIVTYNVRLSAPKVDSQNAVETSCSDTEDGSVKLIFNRTLFKGEQLNYTLLNVDTDTPTDYHGELSIDTDKTFSITDLIPGNYMLQLVGFKDGLSTSTSADRYDLKAFSIKAPSPVNFSITKNNDINCFGGKDGAINIVATGGAATGIYEFSIDKGLTWTKFSNADKHTIEGLPLGFCYVKVRKMVNLIDNISCIAKNTDQSEKMLSEEIKQPLEALKLVSITPTDPTFYRAENGSIMAIIKGGRLIGGNSYLYEWRNSKDELIDQNKTSTKFANGVFEITLNNVPEDKYTLSVTDGGKCKLEPQSIPELTVTLDDPEPIKLKLKIRQAISCNSANLGENSSSNKASASNGSLVALAEGGKILDTKTNKGLPYYFSWKKLNETTGNWDDLDEEKDSIVSDRSKGLYSVNVTDANGIMHGTYTLTEQTPIAVELPIAEPDEMKVVFTSGNVSCFEGTNGWAKASIKDGKSTYTYTWYLPDNIKIKNAEIKDLIKGKYYVEAVDNKEGCFVRDSITIDGPTAPLALKYLEVTPPTFAGGANGKIVAEITGGTPYTNDSYNFKWINKDKTQLVPSIEIVGKKGDADHKVILTLEGLTASVYSLTVTDENYRDIAGQIKYCSIIDSQKELDEPKPLKVTFERKEISCNSGNEFGSAKDTSPSDGQRDESQDGMLIAHVTGGTTLFYNDNKGLPYFYHWKKQEPNGTWKDLETIKDSIATNLSDGNYALNVEDRHKIILGTYANGSWTAKDSIQPMKQPLKLVVTITKGDVFCNGGNDGWATAKGAGGTGPYTYIWSNGVEIAENTILKKGKYTVYVTDFRGCTTQQSITISEPEAPLSIKYTEVLNPSFYKATNGKIVAEITGGTIFSDKTYWFEWKNSKGIKQTSTTAQFNNGVYTITLNGVPEDTYSLTIRDANYVDAVNKTGCTMLNSVTALDDPDPLEVTLEVVRTISCNVNNEFGNEADVSPLDKQRDESQDGILVARVKGGIPLEATKNKGLLYYYTWKKKQKDGSWAIWNDHDETAENLSDGIYALNIEDANGIKLGTYVNNALVKEIDITQNMPQPAQLKLAFTKLDVGCTTGDDGWAEAKVSGGTSPYTYEWTNEATTARIENLTSNNYFVKVTDAKGCVVQGSIFVGDPNGVMAVEKLKNPTCFDGNDGAIQLTVSGGNLPYTYKWNTGDSTKDIAGLKAGNYEVTITCPDCCVYKKKFVLVNPNKITIDLGPDRTLCNDQALELNAAIADEKAQYLWTSTNGFTASEAKVSLSKAGTYHVKAISGLGCIIEDEIVIKTSQAIISSEFLLSSQAYLDEEVILVNTSNPYGENTEWIIPNGVKIVENQDKYITLKFEKTGVYAIGLKQTQGDCYAIYNKNITVEERSAIPDTGNASKFITGFIVTPNPNDGNFKAIVTLENSSPINLRLFSTTGQNTMIQKTESGKKKYEVDFGTSLAAGMYVLVLETAQQTLVKKIIIY